MSVWGVRSGLAIDAIGPRNALPTLGLSSDYKDSPASNYIERDGAW